jgi:hypothetical protein
VKAKVFILKCEKLGVDVIVVEGMLSVHGSPVTVLIDPESTYSFVNKTCTCHMSYVGEVLPYVLHVSTPLGRTSMASRYVPDYNIQVGRTYYKEI